MTRILNRIERGAEKAFLALVLPKPARKKKSRGVQLALPGAQSAKPKRARKPRLKDAWKYDPVIAGGFEVFPDGRAGLWLPVRLRTPQESELSHWRGRHKWNGIVERTVAPFLLKHLKGLDPHAVEEVWFVQLAPKNFFDGGDNLGGACKHIRDCFCRHIGRDDASWKKGAIRWRYMWMKHEAYGCLMLLHGHAEGGRYDRVKDGFVQIQRANGGVLNINVRDELRDTE
jgi:hypothetical protein